MSWYSGKLEAAAVTSAWAYRAAVSVANSAPAATVAIQFTIPKDWDHFWDNVLATGADIRVDVDFHGQSAFTGSNSMVMWVSPRRCTIPASVILVLVR